MLICTSNKTNVGHGRWFICEVALNPVSPNFVPTYVLRLNNPLKL